MGKMTRRERIESKLMAAFEPTVLEVINESHMHNVPKGAETHFRVVVVSRVFEAEPTAVARHRLVYGALAEETSSGLHALTMTVRTPAEWDRSPLPLASPPCLGGSRSG